MTVSSADRRALVDRLLKDKGIRRGRSTHVPRRPHADSARLSFAQEGIWLAAQLHPERAAYDLPIRLRLRGRFEVRLFAATLGAIVSRHEVLRTSIAVRDGVPTQVVHQSSRVRVAVVDIEGVDQTRRDRHARAAARRDAAVPLRVHEAPLLRAIVVRLGPDDHVLLLTIHHLAADGWSLGLFQREFAAGYVARIAGQEPERQPPPVQYPDFAEWQRATDAAGGFDEGVRRWVDRLTGAEPLQLAIRASRPAAARRSGRSVVFDDSARLARATHALARRHNTTPFVVWLAAMFAWLHRYSAQRDLTIGAPVANRVDTALADAIGCYVNPLVLRCTMTGALSFDDLVRRVHGVVAEAFGDQDVPYERILQALRATGRSEAAPLFDAACVFHPTEPGMRAFAGMEVTPFVGVGDSTRVPFELDIWDDGETGRAVLVYDSGVVEPSLAFRMVGHFTTLMLAAFRTASAPIAALPFLTPEECRQVTTWNATSCAWPSMSVVDLVEAQVARSPEAIALVGPRGRRTYRELWNHARGCATQLAQYGVASGAVVALIVSRDADAVALALGVLMAGAAYVPLDASAPVSRLRRQLSTAQPRVVVTGTEYTESFDDLGFATCRMSTLLNGPSSALVPLMPIDLETLAYVIFTSGSTGVPKGVMVTHRGLSNYVQWARATYPGVTRTTLWHTSLAVDLTVTSVWLPLISGGTIRLIDPAQGIDGVVAALRTDDALGFLKLTPSHWRAAMDLLPAQSWASPSLSLVVGGEALDSGLVTQWFAGAPGPVFNEYGPTETVVGSVVQRLESAAQIADPVPVGRPLANTGAYVVTDHWQLAPPGVEGDLWLGGAGVAWGYLSAPRLTAERFVPDRFSGAFGTRLYRTGDRARTRADGALEYLGRRDSQVKIRGHRIELGEIEACLREQPGVEQAVVVARNRPGDREPQLLAYIQAPASINTEKVREVLAGQLPAPWIPPAVVRLAALPLTSHGKVDRGALSAAIDSTPDEAIDAARSPAEGVVAAIWSEILARDAIGIHDNFFTLGGHSLLATRILSRMRTVLGVDLSLRTMFEAPTVSQLAARVIGARRDERSTLPPLGREQKPEPWPASYAQQRLWFVQQLDEASGFLNVPLAIRMRGAVAMPVVHRALQALIRRHDALRARFAVERDQIVQRTVAEPGVPFVVADLTAIHSAAREQAAHRLATVMIRRPFDLTRGPLLRAGLIRTADDDHILVTALHHIATDAWSMTVLAREFGQLYDGYASAAPPRLPTLPVGYADFAVWQRRWLEGPVGQRQMEYWRRQLGDMDFRPLFGAATAAAGRGRVARRRGTASTALGPALAADVRSAARSLAATVFMFALAAFEVALHARTGRKLFAVGTDVANRRDPQLEWVVGFFVNQIALRADLRGNPSFSELVSRARAITLDAFDHQDLPFERLVRELSPPRQTTNHPIFQVSLLMDHIGASPFEMANARLEPFAVRTSETQVDLAVTVVDRDSGLWLGADFDRDLFTHAEADAILRQLGAMLQLAVASPGATVDELCGRLDLDESTAWRQDKQTFTEARTRLLARLGRGATS